MAVHKLLPQMPAAAILIRIVLPVPHSQLVDDDPNYAPRTLGLVEVPHPAAPVRSSVPRGG